MKLTITLLLCAIIIISCQEKQGDASVTEQAGLPIKGTWQLLTGTLTEKGVATVTDYTKGQKFIKIINDTHFAFFNHDLAKGKDTSVPFSAGGGTYTLKDSSYTENLEYCNDRQWEGNSFNFTITIKNDTLIQQGIEKIDSIGVNRMNVEKYIRLKN